MYEKKNQTDDVNPYRWMITYTDLVTLLLTFFVLLISLSVISEERKFDALSSVTGAFGFEQGGQDVLGTPRGMNLTTSTSPLKEEDVALEQLRTIELKNSLEKDMSIVKEEERIIISFGNRLLFKPRSAQIEPQQVGFLSELRAVLKSSPSRIELRGYADPSETIFEPDRLRPAMMLSTKRAFAVLEFLSAGGEIPPKRIVAHGFGHTPLTTAGPKDVDQQNRQAQIILDYREKLPYRLTKPPAKPFLDFKGFLFKRHGGERGE